MTEPRRVRTQVERDADGTTWRHHQHDERVSDGRRGPLPPVPGCCYPPDAVDLLEVDPFCCEKCGNDVTGRGSLEKLCRLENCVIITCRNCGYEWASWGPVGCPCQSRDPKIRRIRQAYRARRR